MEANLRDLAISDDRLHKIEISFQISRHLLEYLSSRVSSSSLNQNYNYFCQCSTCSGRCSYARSSWFFHGTIVCFVPTAACEDVFLKRFLESAKFEQLHGYCHCTVKFCGSTKQFVKKV